MRFHPLLSRMLAYAWLSTAICGCERSDFVAPDPTNADPDRRDLSAFENFEIADGRTSSGVGNAPLTEDQLLSVLNISNWRFPVKVPEGAWRLDCHLDHYHGDRYVETLVRSGVGGDYESPLPEDFEIAVMVQFPPDFAHLSEGLRHARFGYFMVSPVGIQQRFVPARKRFQNLFFGKGVSSVGGIGGNSIDAMLSANGSNLVRDETTGAESRPRTEKEMQELDREVQELRLGMIKNRQIALMEAEDGTNLRLTFDFFPRPGP